MCDKCACVIRALSQSVHLIAKTTWNPRKPRDIQPNQKKPFWWLPKCEQNLSTSARFKDKRYGNARHSSLLGASLHLSYFILST